MLAMPKKHLVTAMLAAVVGVSSFAQDAVAQELEDDGYDIDYARTIAPWRGPIGAATNWGADLPGEFNPALGYYGSYGYWGYGTAGGFHFWDLGGPHRPPLRALHGNWWWQSGMHPYALYEAVIALRNQEEREQMLQEDLPPVPTTWIEPDSSLLIVNVPAEARVFINDRATTSTGERRQFAPRGLQPNTPYLYRVRVEMDRDGQTWSETKVVRLSMGNQAVLAFSVDQPQNVVSKPAGSVR